MSNISLSTYEIEVIQLFFKDGVSLEISPKDVDSHLEFGEETVIDLFLDLEVKGLVQWIHLNLVELELERSTKEIYQEVYNSKAKLSQDGQSFMKDSNFYNKAA